MHRLMRLSTILLVFLLTPLAHATAQTPAASPAASPVAWEDRELSFESGPDTLYGSLRVPAGVTGPGPAVLLISGSGPTDRDGDNPQVPMGTNRNIVDDLDALGVVSFRYDKVGSGETGLASHETGETVDYELFLQGAWDAFDTLADQPEVDEDQIIVLGHSEGSLYALEMAADGERELRPAGIVLAAPTGLRFLDIVREQLENNVNLVVELGQSTEEEGQLLLDEVDSVIAGIRDTGKVTGTISEPAIAALFAPESAPFLYQIDKRDPAELAANVPSDMPVLILYGLKDEQVFPHHVDRLEGAFKDAGHADVTRVDIEDANHIFQVIEGVPTAQLNYLNESLPFSPEVGDALEDYMQPFLKDGGDA